MKKQILFVMDSMHGGGAEKVLLNIINNLNTESYDITLFLCRHEGVYLKDLRGDITIKHFLPEEPSGLVKRKIIYSLQKRLFKFFLKSKIMTNFFIRGDYDVAISFLEGTPTEITHNLERVKRKLAWVHTDINKHFSQYEKEREKKIYKSMDSIYCVSKDAQESFCEFYPEIKERVFLALNPIETEKVIAYANEEIDMEFRDDEVNIIAIGRLVNSAKGFDILLKAHKINIDKKLNHKLRIIGEGDDKDSLLHYIKENKLDENTSLLGFIKNPHPYLKKSDIFVISSNYEGFPLVLVEALTLGKAIVSTNCTGPREALQDGKYGIVVETGDHEQLASAIALLAEDKLLRREYQRLALIKSKEFNFETAMNKINDIIKGNA